CYRSTLIELAQTAPCFRNRPFSHTRQGVGDLLWPLLTSALPSLPVAGHLLGTAPREAETSLSKTLILPPVAAGFLNAVSERLSGLTICGWPTPPHRPSIRFPFVRSVVCCLLPPHPSSRRRSCP